MLAIGKHLGLEREERAARVHEVDARQTVVEGDLLRAHVLLDRDRIVGAAFHRRVVGDDNRFAAGDTADAGDDARPRCVVVIHVLGGERRELEERRLRVEEAVDTVADGQLALVAMPLEIFRAATLAGAGQPLAQLTDELLHPILVGFEGRVGRVDMRVEDEHHQPQQSVL